MMFSALPVLPLKELTARHDAVVLCATPHLAQELRRAHAALCAACGAQSWRALAVATPAQWLDHLVSAALLRGEIPAAAMPGMFLTRAQELALWQEAIREESESGGDSLAAAELFDLPQLARTAREAGAIQRAWRISVPDAWEDKEYQAFLCWQQRVQARCEAEG